MSTPTETKPVAADKNGTLAPAQAPNVVQTVAKQVRGYMERKQLLLPEDYSPENALKSAWLVLQSVADRDGKPALQVCTQASMANALLDMVVQGLNPAKRQCYFIVYGKSLTCQRSYFGDQALVERVMPGCEIYSGVVYEGDEFEYDILRGRKLISLHRQKLGNVDAKKIVAAYCGVVAADGEDLGAEVMTIDRIHKSWEKSKTYKPSATGGTTHSDFADEMALRTVIRRRCKPIINASNDAMLLESIRRSDEDAIDAEVDEEIALVGNGEILSLGAGEPAAVEEAPHPASEPAPKPEVVATAKEEEAPY